MDKTIEENIRLAKVKGAFGVQGQIFILPFTPNAQWIYDLTQITLVKNTYNTSYKASYKDRPLKSTFHIQSFKKYKNGYLVKLQGCNDRTEANYWQGAFVMVPLSHFTSQPGKEIYLIEVKGFIVVHSGQQIGPIVSFSSNGSQDLIQVRKNGQIYDIPFVQDFITQIDWQNKYIYMNLPYGLLGEDENTPSIEKLQHTLMTYKQ